MRRGDNPLHHQGMMLLINQERLLTSDEKPQVFVSKAYPQNQYDKQASY